LKNKPVIKVACGGAFGIAIGKTKEVSSSRSKKKV
jgi:hypothetical protein